ncbi:thioredoxin family protein [Achromobacter sp. D10]|uniref:thioredoxin family protein n=1 Tax=Achromobacter sp. D10 TaxID=3110765 RepID=UPI002B463D08|nr:thioredoxin family protein [Achromobacter sp. D10]MEB3095747.1 thioredoxin family protein [Achromobacter sp. D10]
MSLLVPDTDLAALRARLGTSPDTWLVACFCAAWCDTCEQYKPKLQALADAMPRHVFAWIDIEDHAELLGDEDVENFPTLLVQIGSRVVFYGPMLPHIGHLERLLESLNENSPAIATALPDLPRMLAA